MFEGSGPGIQAADGSSVELYRLLPYLGDLDPVRSFLKKGASILELGCGTGRLTRVLLDWGLIPTAVDASAEMLAELPPGARGVQSSIEVLRLPSRFDVVLLASCLIHHPEPGTRRAFLATAAEHLHPGGRLLLERHDPKWLSEASVGFVSKAGPANISLESVTRREARVDMELCYELDGQQWRHRFTVEPLSQEQIESLLVGSGFRDVSWYGEKRRWAAAIL